MLSQQIGNGFYLDDHPVFNQQVSEILTDNLLFVTDFKRDLVFNTHPPAAELNHQRFLINFFKKPITQNLIDGGGPQKLDNVISSESAKN